MKSRVKNMKTMRNLLLAGIIVAFWCSIASAQIIYGNAQIIYFNAFNGGAVSIDGTAPTVANHFAGGSSSALWNSVVGVNDTSAALANGTVDATANSVLLPFTPQSGYLYTLTASVSFSSYPGYWVNIGFAHGDPVNEPANTPTLDVSRFADIAVKGYNWMIANPSSADEQYFAGPRAAPHSAYVASQDLMDGLGTYTLQVELDTTATDWVGSAFVDGVQLGTKYVYSTNPTIGTVGYGQDALTSGSGIQWNYLMLTATTVPEPSTPALIGAGLATIFLVTLYRRWRNPARKSMAQGGDLVLQPGQILD